MQRERGLLHRLHERLGWRLLLSARDDDRTEAGPEVAGEAKLEGVDPDEFPGAADVAKRLVEEEEAPRGSTEEGGPIQRPRDEPQSR
jgi:hypothetical protein